MEIIHISAECYPMAKAGGLGDVVGALPKYQTKLGHFAKVVMPMYRKNFYYRMNGNWYMKAVNISAGSFFITALLRRKQTN